MDIAFAFDELYADHAQVAIESILDSQPPGTRATFWLLTTGAVAEERGEHLRRQLDGRAGLHLLSTGDEYRGLPVAQPEQFAYISTGMYLRLLLPDLLPPGTRRLLYLDCDVLVAGDLGPLWRTPLAGAPLAAVRDVYVKTFADFGGLPGADPADDAAPYFNSGVMLINLPEWREARITERCLAYLAEHAGVLRLPDQDALNLATVGRWVRVEHRWNHMRSWLLEPAVIASGAAGPSDGRTRIMHFAGQYKPWTEGFLPGFRLDRFRSLADRVAALRPDAPVGPRLED